MRNVESVSLFLFLTLIFTFAMAIAGTNPSKLGPDASISFAPGTANISATDKMKLRQLVREARERGKIDEVQVAAWSDHDAPNANQKLSKADRDLAEKRAKAIKNYLKDPLEVADVDSYNMAEHANWLARSLNTDEAKLKTEVTSDRHDSMTPEEFAVFKEKGQPSKAVVVVVMQ